MRKFIYTVLAVVLFTILMLSAAFRIGMAMADDTSLDLPVELKSGSGQTTDKTKQPPPLLPPLTPVDSPVPPPVLYGHDLKNESASVVYVIDISGSMGWDMSQYTTADGKTAVGCRLDRAKASLVQSIVSLPKEWKFDVLAYDCSIFEWQAELRTADESGKQEAASWVNGLSPGGATGTGPAGAEALNMFKTNKLVVLLSDGAPNCGAGDNWGGSSCIEAHKAMIKQANSQKAEVDTFGIGASGYFKQFLEDVASDNGGSYTDVK